MTKYILYYVSYINLPIPKQNQVQASIWGKPFRQKSVYANRTCRCYLAAQRGGIIYGSADGTKGSCSLLYDPPGSRALNYVSPYAISNLSDSQIAIYPVISSQKYLLFCLQNFCLDALRRLMTTFLIIICGTK